MSRFRVAVGAILTECNQIGGVVIDLSWFERYTLARGEEILEIDSGVVGGMLNVLKNRQATPVPLVFASTCPGGPIASDCYAQLKTELLDRLKQALPVDGVLLPLHGAATVEDVDDPEGDLIRSVRDIVGPSVPIVATLDLHAHVTSTMVRHANALVAWETYPHRDTYTTGERGAQLLMDTLEGRCQPQMVMAKVPVITSAIRGSTEGDDPFADLMRHAKSHEGQNGILSTSVFLIHPYLDQEDMGSGCVVVADGDLDRAETLAREVATMYWARRFDLEPEVFTPAEAIEKGQKIPGGPIVLVEAADCCGGGAVGDSIATLRALLEADAAGIVQVVDPEAAVLCHQSGIETEVTFPLGHKLDPRWGKPIPVTGKVTGLSDGQFTYAGGIWDGVEGQMGPSAVLTVGNVQILIASHATYDWLDEQYQSLNLDPSTAKFVVVKNPMNYRMVFEEIAKEVFILNTPGPTPPTVRHISFQKLKRPYFPLDENIPGMEPEILR
ncbi:MAG: M81 family metallopeptidase [bacterium]|nr:M81 family metallopeptidase [bacterium]